MSYKGWAVGGLDTGTDASVVFELRDAQKRFGSVDVFTLQHLRLRTSEIVAIVGPSGCGKTTLLSVLAGLEPLTSGNAIFEGTPISMPLRDVGIVFQRSSVFPWLTAKQNVALGQSLGGKRAERTIDYLAEFGLTEFVRAWPRQMSGGMLRRLELARAVARRPHALLLDEPFSALDPVRKEAMHAMLRKVHNHFVPCIVLVTHDVDEAIALANRIVVLSDRPATIIQELTVDLPTTSRSINSTSPDFFQMKASVLSALGWKHES